MTRNISCTGSISFSFAKRNPKKKQVNETGQISMEFTAFIFPLSTSRE